jgi:hypothetical protein
VCYFGSAEIAFQQFAYLVNKLSFHVLYNASAPKPS